MFLQLLVGIIIGIIRDIIIPGKLIPLNFFVLILKHSFYFILLLL